MKKQELIAAVSKETKLPKRMTSAILDTMLETITETLAADEKVQLSGFGTFRVKQRSERDGFNPYAKQHIVIPAKKNVCFKPSRILKSKINKK